LSDLDIDSDDGHIRLGRCSDYMRSRCKDDAIEKVYRLNYFLDNIRCNRRDKVFIEIGNTQDLEV